MTEPRKLARLCTLLSLLLATMAATPSWAARPVSVIDIDGAITPITVRLLAAAIERAQAEGSQALVVQLKTQRGAVTVETKGAPVKVIDIRFRDRFLALITDPNIAYILMMVGMLGIFFELSNPGVVLPGVIGGISLILAFFAFQSLPINWAGVLLILFGVALLIAEIKIASHGVLTIGGVISMVLGSFMLYDAPEAGFRVSWAVIIPTVGATAGLFVWAVSAGVRAMRRPQVTGAQGMVGRLAVARGELGPEGQVNVDGELWRAVAEDAPVPAGEKVRVTAVDGLTLRVSRAGDRAQTP